VPTLRGGDPRAERAGRTRGNRPAGLAVVVAAGRNQGSYSESGLERVTTILVPLTGLDNSCLLIVSPCRLAS
jgi:hypothetical protein